MKLIRQFLLYVGFFVVFWLKSNVLYAYIPPEIQLNAVFNFLEEPVSGNQQVTVRLISNGKERYKEIIDDVYFDHGVAQIVIGGDGSKLINSIFDDPDLQVKITVLKHQLSFPMNSVPYAIRSKESNKARRVDNENLMKFLEKDRRVGVNTLTPEVALDINGVLRVQDKLVTDEVSNGVLYFDGVENKFFVYKDSKWVSLSWYPDPEDQSKWTRYHNENSIGTLKNVGIGLAPNSYALAVSNNATIINDLQLEGELFVSDAFQLLNGHGFSGTADLTAASITLNAENYWVGGDIVFSGVLQGDGSNLTSLHHFPNATFDGSHISSGIISTVNIQAGSISGHHILPGIVSPNQLILNTFDASMIEDLTVSSNHIVDGSIQNHHMKRAQISSVDIKLNEFVKEKFANNAIQSYHIADGAISSVKIADNQFIAEHFNPNVISTEKILNGQLTGNHVPLASIPLTNYNDTFVINRGGTGKTSFDPQGVLYTSSSEYKVDASKLSIVDGRMGINVTPKATQMISLGSQNSAIMAISANNNQDAVLKLENSVASWNFTVHSDGEFSINKGSDKVIHVDWNGNVGFGRVPSVNLSLNGPIYLAGTSALPSNGVIRYQNNQFQAYSKGWINLTSNMLSLRYFPKDQLENVTQSTVLYAKNSDLVGDLHMVHSIESSKAHGQALTLSDVRNSSISGVLSSLAYLDHVDVSVDYSDLSFTTNSTGVLDASLVMQADDLNVSAKSSHIFNASSSTINAGHSDLNHLKKTQLMASMSAISHVENSHVNVENSSARHLKGGVVEAKGSRLNKVVNSRVKSKLSSIENVSHSTLNVSNSDLLGPRYSDIAGLHISLLGGQGHDIDANYYMGLLGDDHQVNGDRAIGVGNQLNINHSDVTLINLANEPMHSDQDGQLKIRANGGVRIHMDDALSLHVGRDGWSNISDQRLKSGQHVINPVEILNKVRQLPVYYWEYKNQEDVLHLGPFSQDFHTIFGYGNSNKVIHSIDADGVLLAAIKGVYLSFEHLTDTIRLNESLSKAHKQKLDDIQTKLQGYTDTISKISKDYDLQHRLMDQFEKDQEVQNLMLDFIDESIDSLNLQLKLVDVYQFRWWFFLSGILGGVLLKVILYWRRVK